MKRDSYISNISIVIVQCIPTKQLNVEWIMYEKNSLHVILHIIQ